jgi:hypothetical protein
MTDPVEGCTREELCALLAEGARIDGVTASQAAMHLVTFTHLPGTRAFARHVVLDTHYSMADHASLPGAWIKSWQNLVRDPKLYPEGHEKRFLRLASSLASGQLVNLQDALANMGWAHAQRIAEAMLIRMGASQYLTFHDTPQLTALKTAYAELSGTGQPQEAP